MNNLAKNLFYLFIILIALGACQNVRDGLTGKKKNNSDEFLVEKKNPLVLPPNFNDLPKPEKAIINDSDKDIDFSGVLSNSKDKKKIIKKKNSELEKSLSKILNSN